MDLAETSMECIFLQSRAMSSRSSLQDEPRELPPQAVPARVSQSLDRLAGSLTTHIESIFSVSLRMRPLLMRRCPSTLGLPGQAVDISCFKSEMVSLGLT